MMAKVIRGSNQALRGRGKMSRRTGNTRKLSLSQVFFISIVLVGTLSLSATTPGVLWSADADGRWATPPHITLEASMPEDDQAVNGEVTEVRLFFSDAPLMRGASIRIVNSSRRLVRSSPPQADATDAKQLSVKIDPALPTGRYVVQWRCIADDGHVMRGDFTFEVSGS